MKVIHDLETVDNYFKGVCNKRIYARSNEDLKTIFSKLDVKDKKILSVLASSDQVFMAYFLGAQKVDTFDTNELTEYYYYLRKWLLEKKIINPIGKSNNTLSKVLDSVRKETNEEIKAYLFWKRVLEKYENIMQSKLFFRPNGKIRCGYKGNVNLPRTINFQQHDIFEDYFKEELYDLVYLSNILDYSFGHDKKLRICKDNLKRLVKNNGLVIATNFEKDKISFNYDLSIYKKYFSDDFYISYVEGKNHVINAKMPLYYVFKKK